MRKKRSAPDKPNNLADLEVGDVILIRTHKVGGGWLSLLEEVTAVGADWVESRSGCYERSTGEGTAKGSRKVGKGIASIVTAEEWTRLGPTFEEARVEHTARREAEERAHENSAGQIAKTLERVTAETWVKVGSEKLKTIVAWLDEAREEKS
jgi:hypothetical protein